MILRPATHDDCVDLAPRLRGCDLAEIALGSGREPLNVLTGAVAQGFSQAICTDSGHPVAVWGVTPIDPTPGLGSIWMLGSGEIETVSLPFLRACRPSIEAQHERYPTLICAPWRENALHLRWLRWLGFTLEEVGHPHFLKATRHV